MGDSAVRSPGKLLINFEYCNVVFLFSEKSAKNFSCFRENYTDFICFFGNDAYNMLISKGETETNELERKIYQDLLE